MRRVMVAMGAVVSFLFAAVPARGVPPPAAPSTTFTPPYSAGPHGGDSYNLGSADPSSGRASVVRVYPYAGAFNCGGSGGFSYLRLRPMVTGVVSSVAVGVANAATDAYTWISLAVRDSEGRWLGGAKLRGPVAGNAQVRTPINWTPELVGRPIVVDMGLEVASACPNADGGTATFRDVVIAGWVRSSPAPPAAGKAAPTGPVVAAVNFAFEPDDPSLAAGAPLVLANGDAAAPHTLTSIVHDRLGRPLFDSGAPIGAGQVALVAGVSSLPAGSYPFYCKVHTEMRGVLTVTA